MPPPLPSEHRGMTANPLKPIRRYRPGKAIAEEPSSSEEEQEEEQVNEQERRKQQEAQRRQQQQRQQAPKATSFPGAAAGKITKGVQQVKIEEDEDEEGFETEEELDEEAAKAARPPTADLARAGAAAAAASEEESEEDEEEEEESEEEESSEEEAPRRVLLRPTFIKKEKRNGPAAQATDAPAAKAETPAADSAAEGELRRKQRQEKADMLVREQLQKEAIAKTAGQRAWDEDEPAGDEEALDDRDGIDPEAEYAAWKLRELKRVKREREAIEAAEKEHEEIERRRNLTAEEREREDREFIENQKAERDATRGQTGFMQRYFHKGAFFQGDLEREGLDKRNIMGSRFADDVNRETLPQYMQIRDMTKLGKKGRTRYKDLRSEDTGRWGEGFDNRSRRDRDPVPLGIKDERFMPDSRDDRPKGPTGANASAVRERRRSRSRSPPRRRSRSRSFSPGDRYGDRSRYRDDNRGSRPSDRDRYRDSDRRDRSRSRDRDRDRYRDEDRSRRKRSPSPYNDRDKRRRVDSVS